MGLAAPSACGNIGIAGPESRVAPEKRSSESVIRIGDFGLRSTLKEFLGALGMPANVEQCEICHKLIGSLDSPWVANEQVVCAFCWATLRIVDQTQTLKQTNIVNTAAHSPIASLLISAVTISAVAGLDGVAVFLARARAWWFHG